MSNGKESLLKTVGVNIAGRRKALGLSQESLAEKVGITQQALARMEQGRIAPKLARLPELAAALQCSVGALVEAGGVDRSDIASRMLAALDSVPAEKQEAFVQHVWATVELMN